MIPAAIGSWFPGIIWQGIVLALAAQAILLAATLRISPSRRASIRRAIAYLLLADALVFLTLAAARPAFAQFNHGPRAHRVPFVIAHLLFAAIISWAIWFACLRRVFNRLAILTAAVLVVITPLALALPGVTRSTSLRSADVTYTRISTPGLPRALDGLRIILLTDTHYGAMVTPDAARARLAPLPKLHADIIIFAGDLASHTLSDIPAAASLLGEMSPPGRRLAVLGNHDSWINPTLVTKELRKNDFEVLSNSGRKLRIRGSDIWIAGVSDPYTTRMDIPETLAHVPAGAFTILLAHGPDVLRDSGAQRAGLILSGHTHGGQVVLPLIGPLATSSWFGPRYAIGLSTAGRTPIYVSRGLGEVTIPLRLLCPPEIAVLELRSDQ